TEIKDCKRLMLLKFIKARSVVTNMPYTYCFRTKTACRFSEGSSYYRSYIKAKKPYNRVLVASIYKCPLIRIRKRRRQLLRLAACLGFRKLRNLFVNVKPKLFVVVYKKSISLMP
ncbi:hypothetical protein CSPAE12_11871, partial [Colletotrichum incanum]